MTRSKYFIVLSLCLFFAYSANVAGSTLLDRIDGVVGDEIITRSEVVKFKESYPRRKEIDPLLSLTPSPGNLTHTYLLKVLIREKLIKQYLDESGANISDEMVNQHILQIQSAYKLSRNQFKNALKSEGYTFSEYFRDMKSSLGTNSMIEREIRPKIRITEDELRNRFYEKVSDRKIPFKYRLSHIFFDPKAYKNRQSAYKFAIELRKRITKGEQFEEIAKSYSNGPSAAEGGDLGVVSLENLANAIASHARKLKVGQLSQVIKSDQGFHLIRIEDKIAGIDKGYELKRAEIRKKIYEKRLKDLLEEWFTTRRQETFVKIIPTKK